MKNWNNFKNWITRKSKEIYEFVTDYPVQFLMGGCFIVGFILGAIIF